MRMAWEAGHLDGVLLLVCQLHHLYQTKTTMKLTLTKHAAQILIEVA